MFCELCGREGELVSALVENIKLDICSNCKKYGKVLEVKDEFKPKFYNAPKNQILEDVVLDFGGLIKNKREEMRLSQIDLALKLNEKEGLISKIENGSIKPNLELAKKIGKFLDLNLITQEKISGFSAKSNLKEATIGDFLKK